MPLPTCSRILWALATKQQTGAEPYSLIEQDYLAKIAAQDHPVSAKRRAFVSLVTGIVNQNAA